MPYYHRRQRVRPGQLRGITDNFIPKWRKQEGAQYGRDKQCLLDSHTWSAEKFRLHVGKMRSEVQQAFSCILPHARIHLRHAFVAFRVCVSEHVFAFRCGCVFGARVSGLWVVVRGWWVAVVGWQPKWLRIGVRCSAFRMRVNCVSKECLRLRFKIAFRCSSSACSNALRALWMRLGDGVRNSVCVCVWTGR